MIIYGINPVLEALRAGRVKEVRLSSGASHGGNDRLQQLAAIAAERRVRVRRVPADVLERESRRGVHQGVVADIEDMNTFDVGELVRGASGPPLIVVLDGIEDPQNLGAILRTADAAGVDGVVVQNRRSAARDGAAAKASAGALAHVKIAEVVNIARAVEELKDLGVWTVGLAADAATSYDAIDLSLPTALVVGAEGSGLRRLVRERCDHLASIPMRGHVGSLNVSVSAGIVLFEVIRQRSRRDRS
jgi:23S rRNA (guanosine2251-2'-O)-methyltransferase